MNRHEAASTFRARTILVPALFAATLLAVAISLHFFLKPKILTIEPAAFDQEGIVVLEGRGFGEKRMSSYVLFDGSTLTESSYLAWSDESIRIRLPGYADSGLVQVRTSKGTSEPKIVIAASRLPVAFSGRDETGSGPAIRGLEPQKARVGDLVAIDGLRFGTNLAASEVRFPRASPEVLPDAGSGERGFIAADRGPGSYEQWDDKRILVRVPEGAGSGFVTVHTPQGDSNSVPFRLEPGMGTKRLYDPETYAVTFTASLSKIVARKDARLLLRFPRPPDTAAQQVGRVVDYDSVPPFAEAGDSRIYSVDSFPATTQTVSHTFLVTVSEVETDSGPRNTTTLKGFIPAFDTASKGQGEIPAYLRPWLSADPLVPSAAKEISATALKIVGKEKDLRRRALAIHLWLKKNIVWKKTVEAARGTPQTALSSGKADSKQYALLTTSLFRAAGIPAAPIAGLLIGEEGTSYAHFWLEYYLPTVGWIPYDPVLASGHGPEGFTGGFAESDLYFGSLDNRHLAISRGYTETVLFLGGSRKPREPGVAWSFQEVFEESEALEFAARWEIPRVLAAY